MTGNGEAITRTLEDLEAVFDTVRETVRSKEAAYGGSWRRRGWRGNLERVLSKSDRLENMLRRREPLYLNGGEGVDETATDQIALLAFLVINLRNGNEWGTTDSGSGGSSEGGTGA